MKMPQPRDAHGSPFGPFDLVRINEIPDFLHSAPDVDAETARAFRSYVGCYGMVIYLGDQAFLGDTGDTPGWRSKDGSHVYVLAVSNKGDYISGYDMFLPTRMLSKLPPNIIISALFLDLPWFLETRPEADEPPTVARGTALFENLSKILRTPYSELVDLHEYVQTRLAK